MVFGRISDVPLDAVDKLIESTNAVYDDLNKVFGHSYWGDLVLHQGSALAALKEARECLDALRSEAIGARNTELGVTVTTAVIEGERYYAQTDEDRLALVNRAMRPPTPGRASHLYVWDRPHENEDAAGPYEQIRLVTDVESEAGVLNFTQETEEGELLSWHTLNEQPMANGPVLRFDAGSALVFPRNSVLGFEELRAGLLEFTRTGERPSGLTWQQARWGE
ncbi:hypothetical protein GCM10027563_32910 [Parasphingorhabdus pacifica]